MSSSNLIPAADSDGKGSEGATLTPEYVAAKELERLPQEMKTVVTVMLAAIRSSSGPDPETAKLVAQSEMHSESCKLDGYKETLKSRDAQNGRDHQYRTTRLHWDNAFKAIFILVCVLGMGAGLYLLVAKGQQTLGSNILLAGFLGLVGGGRFLAAKEKD